MTQPRHVVCFQQHLTHYREAFFQRSRDRLAECAIRFDLVHGAPDAAAKIRNDRGQLPWAYEVEPVTIKIYGTSGVWVPMAEGIMTPQLVVVTQENRLLANYAWLLRGHLGGPKVAFWGHGRNFQANAPAGLREQWKKLLVGRVDWWFAYTQMTRDILLGDAYPDERITVLDNAIDNDAFQRDLASVTDADLIALRAKVSVGEKGPVGIFCGSLYPDKRVGLMIKAADRIRAAIPSFSLVVIGDGPSADEVKAAALSRPWLHWVGVQKGREKAAWFKLASVVFNPGSVGLHILDSFCSGVPMVTTSDARHGPEIAYLDNGFNGLLATGGAATYAHAVVSLLSDHAAFEAMRANALASASRYTLDNMVTQFCDGIERCLAMDKKR
jgi:glycosyltransferase involved in cell wall biosynthesis